MTQRLLCKLAVVLLVKPAPAAEVTLPICCIKEVEGTSIREDTYYRR